MARRRGSGRGKSSVNSRKSALENARERQRDDSGGSRTAQHNHHNNNTNMEAATTTTTKNLNSKNKQLLNNHRSLDRRSATATATNFGSTSATGTKKVSKHNANVHKTYQISGESAGASSNDDDHHIHHHHAKTPKLTAKQSKAAAKAAAAAAVAAAAESATPTEHERLSAEKTDPLAISVEAKSSSSPLASSKHVSPTNKKEKLEQKTATTNAIASTATATATVATSQPTNNRNSTNSSNSSSKKSSSSDNNSSNKLNTKSYPLNFSDNCTSSNSSSHNNSSNKNSTIHRNALSAKNTTETAPSSSAPAATNSQTTTTTTVTTTAGSVTAATWNTSKYLHKKFKRLASTTENDADSASNKLRTTSMSSASSASPPPSATDVASRLQPTHPATAFTALLNGHHQTSTTSKEQSSQHVAATQLKSVKQNELLETSNVANALSNVVDKSTLLLTNVNNNNINNKFNSIANNGDNNLVVPRTIYNNSVAVISSTTTKPAAATPTASAGQTHQHQQQLQQEASNAVQQQSQLLTSMIPSPAAEGNSSSSGRHVCPFCSLNCTKPSVLQKHIRAHTNERPYPCNICGFAFKTKSNYYKHCRSRTHNARKRGIELPADVDDGSFAGSDQEQDLDSNSSSDVISRTASPLDDSSVSLPAAPYHQLQQHPLQQQPLQQHSLQQQRLSPANVASPTPSPSSLSAAKSAYLQQPAQQQQQQLPLGSPAAGTLPPSAASIAGGNKPTLATSLPAAQKQSIDYKPYKPKFHKAALYATGKEAEQQLEPQKQSPAMLHQNSQYHHPTLSPSTQVKLNNHINSHQVQMQQQHQQQLHQLHSQQQHPPQKHPQQQHSINAINAGLLPLAPQPLTVPGVYYLAQTPPAQQPSSAVAAVPLMHSTAHMPQPYYSPVAAAAAAAAHQQALVAFQLMTPQQQQQFHHQVQLQQHMQQQQQMQMQQQSSALLKPHQQQRPPAGAATNMQTAAPLTLPPQQSPLQFLANAATSISNSSTSAATSTHSGLIHGNISAVAAVASSGGVQLNKEFLTEHITKLISQNEAIVENKELLLQKKYPKTLNRSRSFNNNNNNNNNNNANNSNTTANNIAATSVIGVGNTNNINTTPISNNNNNNLVISSTPVAESANAKLAQAIASKQQLQQQQHQQQQHQQQQQHAQLQLQQHQHYQQMQNQVLQQQQHQQLQQRLEEQQQQQHAPLNGLSKHIQAKHPHQQYRPQPQQQPQQQQKLAPMSLQLQAQHLLKEATSLPAQQSVKSAAGGVLPLNLSAKPKHAASAPADEYHTPASTAPTTTTTTITTPTATPRKRQSIEHQSPTYSDAPITSSAKQAPPNNSIIKNLLLNARGLAVPTGEGEDAVYTCPLCLLQFRTAEDLQLHNSTYCQGAACSAPISPVSSPSYKYFRSNSISLNLPDLKNSLYLSQNPLSLASLAKVAWSQLKTKPSSLVLNQLSATHSKTTATTTSTTTSITITTTATATVIATSNNVPSTTTAAAAADCTLRLIDAPLPSPGPLLGKTPLVDCYNHGINDGSKSEDVIITKMHEDRQFTSCSNSEAAPSKRSRYDFNDHLPLYPTSSKQQPLRQISTSGGDMQLLAVSSAFPQTDGRKEEQRMKRFTSSGGCMIPISECSDIDMSPKMIRTPLLSGGSFQEVLPKPKESDPPKSLNMPITSQISGLNLPLTAGAPQHFQFPPINSITAFNPLTLPPMSSVGGESRAIPYVPGIPGPNSLTPQLAPPVQQLLVPLPAAHRALSPNRKKTPSPMTAQSEFVGRSLPLDANALSPFAGMHNVPSELNRVSPSPALRSVRNWVVQNTSTKQHSAPSTLETPKKSFNFQRIADNLSPRKPAAITVDPPPKTSADVRHFNFDSLNKQTEIASNPDVAALTPLHVDTSAANTSSMSVHSAAVLEEIYASKKSRFLRPTSLPLKPGTFTPKRHHGITPNANTLSLISPETPRPSKACVQLYLNGHAYTYLGLKCSTKVFYCTVNLPQPSYVADNHKLSMYSVWQVRAENNPYPLGLKPKLVMSLYDSRQKSLGGYIMAGVNRLEYMLVVSQQAVMTPFLNNKDQFYHHQLKPIAATSSASEQLAKEASESSAEKRDKRDSDLAASSASSSCSSLQQQALVGGYESHEDYTYIRGRGRGRYVCSECGIRCKKPSMLKKHIRTHTDVRPYTCKNCNFSFKTKGNLTKHMQSKTHYRKCIELGINPGPMPADGEFLELDVEFDQQSSTSAGGRTSSLPGESDSEDFSDAETESSDTDDAKSRLQEHEAARCLLSLSMTPPIGQTTAASPHLKNTDIYTFQQTLDPSPANTTSINMGTNNLSSAVAASGTLTQLQGSSCSVKRVVTSFTSPKPPFDYQKQEQYYSNPEESKPKRIATASAGLCFESAPIDLTKPRSVEAAATASKQPLPSISSNSENSPNGSPLKTQAQIRDIIFGTTKNESGFLKTLISVSDKVRNSAGADHVVESPKKLNENVLLQAYLTEQALQYSKMKQCQMNRNVLDASSDIQGGNGTFTMTVAGAAFPSTRSNTPNIVFSNSAWKMANSAANVVTTSSAAFVSTSVSSAAQDIATGSKEIRHVVVAPPIESEKNDVCQKSSVGEVNERKCDSDSAPHPPKSSACAEGAQIAWKSSDEGEESECPSDQEHVPLAAQAVAAAAAISSNNSYVASGSSAKDAAAPPSHNANLPAAVQQPGTTDFSGVLSAPARTVIVGEDGFKKSANNEILPVYPRTSITTDGRPVCTICSKSFQKQHQLVLHMNIHYMERKFKCESCGVSFRTQGHLQKHERSEAHKNKVMMTSTFGVPTTSNPRPFECTDCKIAFRIHGHLAKHLRSKTHVQKLECLQKLPFGTYAEIERAGISLTEIDTSDCENSLISLKLLAQKLIEKDPSKLSSYTTPSGMQTLNDVSISCQDSASEDGFSAAASAAATAIASLDNDSATNTPRRGNSLSEEESTTTTTSNVNVAGQNSFKRRPVIATASIFSNGEESDNQAELEKRPRLELSASAASPASSTTSNASN